MNRIASVTRMGAVAGMAALLWSCGPKAVPCTGSGCYPIGGGYAVVFASKIACPDWAQPPLLDVSFMGVSESGSTVSLTLAPSTVSGTVTFNGTENTDGNVSVTQPDTSSVLGIPYGQVDGSFSSLNGTGTQPPYEFTGTLTLIPTGGDVTPDGGTASGCSGTYNFTAQQSSDANGNAVGPGGGGSDGG